ncbi:hypothetical protein A2U01_0086849, partial [Trifolium medium]|nr:hypothetical protein [Trifolium medium]
MSSGCKNEQKSTKVNPMNSDLRRAREELSWAQMAGSKRAPQVHLGAPEQFQTKMAITRSILVRSRQAIRQI